MEERGDHSDRAQQNRDIKAANENLELLRKELAESQTRLIQLRRQLADERMEQIQKTVRAVDPFWDKAEQRQAPTPERPAEPEPTAKQPEPSRLPPRRPHQPQNAWSKSRRSSVPSIPSGTKPNSA